MSDFRVIRVGVDSSGRDIFLTRYHDDWLKAREANLGFPLTIVQGAFMTRNGGGASKSEGFHDKAGCVDLRTRDLTHAQIDAVIRELRDHGAGAWRRDKTAAHGGMDPHIHYTLGADFPLSEGAQVSWESYLGGGDGLEGPGNDYEYRPNPLVLTPPEEDMPLSDEDVQRIADAVWAKKVPTADAPEGRYIANIAAKVYNKAFPKVGK